MGAKFLLEPFLAIERESCEGALGRALGLLLPSLPEALRGPLSRGVLVGGKRLRPILFATVFSACRGQASLDRGWIERIYDLAAGLEMIHAYSLMHDDLPCMDDAPLRRGAATPHTVYGEALTMRAGLVLIPLSGLRVWLAAGRLGLDPERRRSIVRVLAQAAGPEGMVGGQAMDLLAEGRKLTREELDDLHRRKTGALLTAAVQLGAVAAGAPMDVECAFERYGRAVGLAFQIADDVLDATANAETLGKNPSDRALGKSTYVRFLGVEAAGREAEIVVEDGLRALREAGIESSALEALAWHIARRDC